MAAPPGDNGPVTGMSPLGADDRFDQHLIAGGELLRQSRLVDAARELEAALAIDQHSGKALALLGLAYFRGGKFAEARPVYERLVQLAPADCRRHPCWTTAIRVDSYSETHYRSRAYGPR